MHKTYVDGRLYIFRNICFVIFNGLSVVVCCIDDCPLIWKFPTKCGNINSVFHSDRISADNNC